MAFDSLLDNDFEVPYVSTTDMTMVKHSSGGGILSDNVFESSRRSGGGYRSTERDDLYYSSRGSSAGSASSSMQVQLSSASEEDTSSLRVRRSQVTVPPVETSRYSTTVESETVGGGYRETYKPGRRSWLTCRRKPEVTSREAYSFSSSNSDRVAGGGGFGGGTYTSITSDLSTDTAVKDRYRVSSSNSYTRF